MTRQQRTKCKQIFQLYLNLSPCLNSVDFPSATIFWTSTAVWSFSFFSREFYKNWMANRLDASQWDYRSKKKTTTYNSDKFIKAYYLPCHNMVPTLSHFINWFNFNSAQFISTTSGKNATPQMKGKNVALFSGLFYWNNNEEKRHSLRWHTRFIVNFCCCLHLTTRDLICFIIKMMLRRWYKAITWWLNWKWYSPFSSRTHVDLFFFSLARENSINLF